MPSVDYMNCFPTGPDTIAGKYMRKFWHPVSRAEDLQPGWAKPIRIMGEDFTLYRGDSRKPYVVDFHCPHRQSTLSVGWVEGDCIRCRFHGWKFDGSGQCVEQPAEKKTFTEEVRIRNCPTEEYLGLIFVYFGEGDPPPPRRYPDFEKAGMFCKERKTMQRVLLRLPAMAIFIAFLCVLWGSRLPAAAQESKSTAASKAKEEGKVAFYTTMSLPEVQGLSAIFEKQYPPIKVELFRSGSGGIINRVQTEFNAKTDLVDVIQGVANRAMVPTFKQRGIIEKYKSPEFKYVPEDLRDKEGYWTSVYQNTYVLVYNKNLVRQQDVPKTYDDLLKPIWKGKKLINDVEDFPWFNGLLVHWGRDKGMSFFQRYAQQEPLFYRGSRLRIQLVSAGEAPLTIAYGSHATDYIAKGAPIGWVALEPVVFNVNSISMAKRAPHPNAAKLFIDFLFSKEAHLHLRAIRHIPARSDVDPEPPELFKGFQRIFAFKDSPNISEVVRRYNATLGIAK